MFVVAPVDQVIVLLPQLPVILDAVNVELPGAQKVEGDAAILKLKGVNTPGTTKDCAADQGPGLFEPPTHSRAAQ